jgi:hypothetical protein
LRDCSPPPDSALADLIVSPLRNTLSPIPADAVCATGIAAPGGSRGPEFACPTAKDEALRDRLYDAQYGWQYGNYFLSL